MSEEERIIDEEEQENVFAIYVPNSPDRHIFKELQEVKNFLDSPMGKNTGFINLFPLNLIFFRLPFSSMH